MFREECVICQYPYRTNVLGEDRLRLVSRTLQQGCHCVCCHVRLRVWWQICNSRYLGSEIPQLPLFPDNHQVKKTLISWAIFRNFHDVRVSSWHQVLWRGLGDWWYFVRRASLSAHWWFLLQAPTMRVHKRGSYSVFDERSLAPGHDWCFNSLPALLDTFLLYLFFPPIPDKKEA